VTGRFGTTVGGGASRSFGAAVVVVLVVVVVVDVVAAVVEVWVTAVDARVASEPARSPEQDAANTADATITIGTIVRIGRRGTTCMDTGTERSGPERFPAIAPQPARRV